MKQPHIFNGRRWINNAIKWSTQPQLRSHVAVLAIISSRCIINFLPPNIVRGIVYRTHQLWLSRLVNTITRCSQAKAHSQKQKQLNKRTVKWRVLMQQSLLLQGHKMSTLIYKANERFVSTYTRLNSSWMSFSRSLKHWREFIVAKTSASKSSIDGITDVYTHIHVR